MTLLEKQSLKEYLLIIIEDFLVSVSIIELYFLHSRFRRGIGQLVYSHTPFRQRRDTLFFFLMNTKTRHTCSNVKRCKSLKVLGR